jgi:hypothetical protein
MSKELTSFFAQLSANPLLIEKFESDPAALLEKFNLSDAEKTLVMTRDLDVITYQLQSNGPVGGGGQGAPQPVKPPKRPRPKPAKKKKTAKKKPAKKK